MHGVSHLNRLGSGDAWDRVTTFIIANMLWMVFAAPVITLPAATAGLFATLTPWVRGDDSEPFRDFAGGMRQHWRRSTLIGLLDALLAVMLVLNLRILDRMPIDSLVALFCRNVAFFVGAVALLMNLYAWPLLVSADLSLRQLLRVSLRLVFIHPLWSLFIGVLALAPLLLGFVLPGFVALLVAFSSCALVASWGAWQVIDQHKKELFDD